MKRLTLDSTTGKWIEAPLLPTSDEMLRRALEYPSGSEMRRSFIEAALSLERRPRHRPKGTVRPPTVDSFAILLMYHIALRTGERGAERLARLAVATQLIHAKAAPASTAHTLAKVCRHFFCPRVHKELDELAAKRGYVEDPDTVVGQPEHDPWWTEQSNGSYGVGPEK